MCFIKLANMIWSTSEEIRLEMMIQDHSIQSAAERIQLLRDYRVDYTHPSFQLTKTQRMVILETMIVYQTPKAGLMTEKAHKRNLWAYMLPIWKLQDSSNQEIQSNLQFRQDLG